MASLQPEEKQPPRTSLPNPLSRDAYTEARTAAAGQEAHDRQDTALLVAQYLGIVT